MLTSQITHGLFCIAINLSVLVVVLKGLKTKKYARWE